MESGIKTEDRDPGIRPQDDLFGYVNGGWLKTAEIPEDRPLNGSIIEVVDAAEKHLHAIVDEAAASDAPAGSAARKVGDLYASFLDSARADELGNSPIRAELAEVAAVRDASGLLGLAGRLHRSGVGDAIGLYVDNDSRDSTRYLVHLTQSGLGLPDESYYREDAFAETRVAYVEHLARMLALSGYSEIRGEAAEVADIAGRILALETKLAAGHWDVIRSRDAVATYTLLDRDKLEALAPQVDWAAWLSGLGATEATFAEVIVRQPSYLTAWSDALADVPLPDWKDWLAWQVINSRSSYLSGDLDREHFDFYGRTLTGTPQQRDRWKRGISLVEQALGEAAGQLYVERHFPPHAKARMVQLVENLVEAYRRNIESLDWMSAETKRKAADKLGMFTPKVGYPGKWRDYSALSIARDDLVGNVRAASAFEMDRDLGKIGQPVDRDEWFMTPQTVNAYYNPGMNEIVFPAAILQPPFFDIDADDALNYGAIGSVIGHEIGHGFDDQGSKYDGAGNLADWWTDEDRANFDARAQALIEQYNAFFPRDLADNYVVNGAFTVGENIGDLGGLTIAYVAYLISLDGKQPPVVVGLTGPQRFFEGWGQCWKTKVRDAEAIRRLSVDPHSPPEFRANVVRNLEEFYAAYDVAEGDGMWLDPKDRVRIW
ncbi:MAG: M13 family metallopeptidase [Geodermatophilaceae bacterium]